MVQDRAEPEHVDRAIAQKALDAIRDESNVIDVLYDPNLAVDWTVAVRNDGSRRTGLADYFCIVLSDHHAVAPTTNVRIVDHAALMANGGDFRAASLAHVDCNSGKDLGV